MFNRFRKVKYPQQQLSDIQLSLTAYIDFKCQETLDSPKDGSTLSVHHIIVPVSKQFMPKHVIHRSILQDLPKTGGYLPRSVAFVQSGLDWHFMVGVYGVEPSDHTKQIMYIDLCTRTNTARNEKENA